MTGDPAIPQTSAAKSGAVQSEARQRQRNDFADGDLAGAAQSRTPRKRINLLANDELAALVDAWPSLPKDAGTNIAKVVGPLKKVSTDNS
jgi:hypothetical protein